MASKITDKQQKFIDCYDGDIKKAAEKANLSYGYCRRLVTKSNILGAIRNRINEEIRPTDIASRQQRQQFWSKTMDDPAQLMRDRLRASELLGKSEMDFPTTTEVSGEVELVVKLENMLREIDGSGIRSPFEQIRGKGHRSVLENKSSISRN